MAKSREASPAQGGHEPLMQRAGQLWHGLKRQSRNPVGESIFVPARIDYPQMFQEEILKGDVHRTARAGRIGVFELETIVFAAEAYQQIQFGATMRRPKVGVARAKQPADLLQRKAFPRGAELGMGLDIGQDAQLQQ